MAGRWVGRSGVGGPVGREREGAGEVLGMGLLKSRTGAGAACVHGGKGRSREAQQAQEYHDKP